MICVVFAILPLTRLKGEAELNWTKVTWVENTGKGSAGKNCTRELFPFFFHNLYFCLQVFFFVTCISTTSCHFWTWEEKTWTQNVQMFVQGKNIRGSPGVTTVSHTKLAQEAFLRGGFCQWGRSIFVSKGAACLLSLYKNMTVEWLCK